MTVKGGPKMANWYLGNPPPRFPPLNWPEMGGSICPKGGWGGGHPARDQTLLLNKAKNIGTVSKKLLKNATKFNTGEAEIAQTKNTTCLRWTAGKLRSKTKCDVGFTSVLGRQQISTNLREKRFDGHPPPRVCTHGWTVWMTLFWTSGRATP